MLTLKYLQLPIIIIYSFFIISVVGDDISVPDDTIYSNGSYLALRLLAAIFCVVLGLTFCFFGQNVTNYIMFFAGVELFGILVFNIDFYVEEVYKQDHTLLLYSIFGVLTIIVSTLAALFHEFGRMILGFNIAGSLWVFLNALGAFSNKIFGFVTILLLFIVGGIVPFFYPELIIIMATTIIGCTFLMIGVDFVAVDGFIFYALDPFFINSKMQFDVIILVTGSAALGLMGLYVQNHYQKRHQKQKKILAYKA